MNELFYTVLWKQGTYNIVGLGENLCINIIAIVTQHTPSSMAHTQSHVSLPIGKFIVFAIG